MINNYGLSHPLAEMEQISLPQASRSQEMMWIKLRRQRLMSGTFDRLFAEVQIGTALLKRFTARGTPSTTRVAYPESQ